jgi:hypothetical protein
MEQRPKPAIRPVRVVTFTKRAAPDSVPAPSTPVVDLPVAIELKRLRRVLAETATHRVLATWCEPKLAPEGQDATIELYTNLKTQEIIPESRWEVLMRHTSSYYEVIAVIYEEATTQVGKPTRYCLDIFNVLSQDRTHKVSWNTSFSTPKEAYYRLKRTLYTLLTNKKAYVAFFSKEDP